MDAAIATLEAGEIATSPESGWPPGYHPETAANFRAAANEMERIFARSQAPPDPPPLPDWAEPWAELVADTLKPIIRNIVRAELRKGRER